MPLPASLNFHLPPFAYWTPEEWQQKGPEVSEIVENGMGWDITDFGLGDYANVGLFLFTLRNGDPADLAKGKGKLYAEKLLIVDVGQITPFHFHWLKTEDIIVRGGGKLAVQLYNATADEEIADTDVTVSTDGVQRTVKAGTTLIFSPGESITLPPYCYHKFWGVDERVLGRRGVDRQRRRCRQPLLQAGGPLPGDRRGRSAAAPACR